MEDSIEEQPKAKIANRVVAQKRKYFLPHSGQEVEARTVEDAVASQDELTNSEDEKDGDA